MGGGTHANPATGTFGGAPYGATNRVRGVPKWVAVPACDGDADDNDDGADDDDDDADDDYDDNDGRREGAAGGRRRRSETRGTVSSKRGPNTTGWEMTISPGTSSTHICF